MYNRQKYYSNIYLRSKQLKTILIRRFFNVVFINLTATCVLMLFLKARYACLVAKLTIYFIFGRIKNVSGKTGMLSIGAKVS